MTEPIVAVVFDFDGLLMDTESTLVETWRAEWAFHGLELDLADGFWPGHGGDVTEHRYERLAARVGPGFDRAASHARRTAHRARLHEELGLRPGIGRWLGEAASLGLRLGVASSSPSDWVREHLSRAGVLDGFDAVATGDETADHKPDPGVYRIALDRLRVPGSRAVAVEDTPHGVAAGRAAGMRTVAIPNPFVDVAELSAADLTLPSAAELSLREVLEQVGAAPRG